jgi:serine/threonine protein kinase
MSAEIHTLYTNSQGNWPIKEELFKTKGSLRFSYSDDNEILNDLAVYHLRAQQISFHEVKAISQFLADRQPELIQEAIKQNKTIHCSAKETGLARGLAITPEGNLYLIFNSRKKGDSILGKGAQKTAKLGLDLNSGMFIARLSSNSSCMPGTLKTEYELGMAALPETIFQPLPDTYGTYAKKDRDAEFFIMPVCDGDLDAYSVTEDTPADEWMCIATQMIASVALLHQSEILHRDIKPANFFKLNHTVRLADLGIAVKEADQSTKQEMLGSLVYMSPEYSRASTPEAIAQATTRKHDGWQLGISLLEKFSSKLPHLQEHWKKIEEINQDNAWMPFIYRLRRLPADWLGKAPPPDTFDYAVYMLLRPDPEQRWLPEEAFSFLEAIKFSSKKNHI